MDAIIEAAVPGDAEVLGQLVNSAYRGETSKAGWTTEAELLDGTRTDAAAIADLIRDPDTTLLKYTEKGEILACVELKVAGSKLYLGMLTVRPHLQGKGIGKVLLERAEAEGRAKGCSSIFMTVISARAELIEWYVRHGYVETGERKPFEFKDPRFGQPRKPLEFVVLEKRL